MRGTVMGKDGLAIFKVKVTVRAHNDNQNNDSFYCLQLDVFATKILFDSTISSSVLWKGWLLCSSSRSLGRRNILMNVCLDDILWTAEPLLVKLHMVVHYYSYISLSVMQREWFDVIRGKVTVGAYIIKKNFSTQSVELHIRLQPNLVWYIYHNP